MENGLSLLHLASKEGKKEIVKFLLETGEDVEALNNFEETSLHLACENGHVE